MSHSIDKTALQQRFNLHLPANKQIDLSHRLADKPRYPFRKAAVLVGFVDRPEGLTVILTKRAAHLRHHPNQISFPGGKHEPSDESLIDTATREATEEIGIAPEHIDVLGLLTPLGTVSEFMVTPVIAIISPNYQASIDPNEVADVFEVPAHYLLDVKRLRQQEFRFTSGRHRIFAMPFKQHLIWGMTAQVIHHLQLQLTEPNTRG